MRTSIGSAFLMLGANTAEFKRGLDSAAKKLNDFDKTLKARIQTLKKFGAAATKAGKALSIGLTAPIVALGAASVIAFDKQIKAEKSLEVALGRVSKRLLEQASAIQKRTRIGDESIIQGQAFLAQMGLEEAAILKLSPLIVDMAEGKGMDLKSAFDLVAKSVGSSTNALTRYGIEITGAVGSSERLNSAVDALTEKFGGQAEAMGDVGLGPLIKLQNAFGDLLEDFGDIITEALNPFIDKIRESVLWMENLDPATKKIIVVVAGLAAAVGPALLLLGLLSGTVLPILVTGFATLTAAISTSIAAFAALALPITLVVAAIALAAFLIIDNWDTIVDYFTTGDGVQMFDAFINVVDNFMDIFVAIWETTSRAAIATWEELSDAIMSIWNEFGWEIKHGTADFMSGVVAFFTGFFTVISSIFASFVAYFRGDWKGLWKQVKIILQTVLGGLPAMLAGLMADMLATIADSIKNVTDWLRKIPKIPGLDTVLKPILKMADSLEGSIRKGSDAVRALADDLAKVVEVGTEAGEAVRKSIRETEKETDDTTKKLKKVRDAWKEIKPLPPLGIDLSKSLEDIPDKLKTIQVETAKGKVLFEDMWENIRFEGLNSFDSLLDKVQEIAPKIADVLGRMFDGVFDKIKGADIFSSLLSGDIAGAAGNLVGGVVDQSKFNTDLRADLSKGIIDIQDRIGELGEKDALTKKEGIEITELNNELSNLQIQLSKVGPSMGALDGIMETLNETVSKLFNSLIPVFDLLFKALEPLLPVFISLLDTIGNLISEALTPFGAMIKSVAEIVGEFLQIWITDLIESFKPLIEVYSDLAPIVGDLLDTIKPLIKPLTGFFGAMMKLNSLFNPIFIQMKILGIFLRLLNTVLEPLMPTMEMFANKIERSVDLFDNWLEGATDLGGLFKFLTDKVLPAIISIGVWLGKTFSFLGEIINKVVVPVFTFFAKAVKSIVEGIVGIINTIINKINDLFKTDINTIDLGGLSLPSAPEPLAISAPTMDTIPTDLGVGSGAGSTSSGGSKALNEIKLTGMFTIRGDDLVMLLEKTIRRNRFGGIGG